MKLMLLPKYVTPQDKRALTLYFAIALLSAVCVALFMLYKAEFHVGKKAETELLPTPTPKSPPRNHQ